MLIRYRLFECYSCLTLSCLISLLFSHVDGYIYELDGRKSLPINHGKSSPETLLEDAVAVVKEFMVRDPEELRFTIIALAATGTEEWSKIVAGIKLKIKGGATTMLSRISPRWSTGSYLMSLSFYPTWLCQVASPFWIATWPTFVFFSHLFMCYRKLEQLVQMKSLYEYKVVLMETNSKSINTYCN